MDAEKQNKNFYDLFVWQKAHDFVIKIYTTTKDFPKEEIYGLTSQIRRAAVSVTNNIAEGYNRKGINEKIQFYNYSKGSITEIQDQLLISRDVGYLTNEKFEELFSDLESVHRLLNLFIKGFKNKANI